MKLHTILGITDALTRGREPGQVDIDLDPAALTGEERTALVRMLAEDTRSGTAPGYLAAHRLTGKDLTTAGLVLAVQETMAAAAKKAEEEAARKADWAAREKAFLAELRARPINRLAGEALANTWNIWRGEDGIQASISDLGEPLASQVRGEMAARTLAARAKTAEAEERAAGEKAAAEKRLLDWATAHGSDLLHARIEGEFSWENLARQEFTTAALAPVLVAVPGLAPAPSEGESIRERDTPTLAEIKVLKAARKAAPEIGFSLAWVRYEEGQGYDATSYRVAELECVVTCPDGHETTRYLSFDGATDTRNQ